MQVKGAWNKEVKKRKKKETETLAIMFDLSKATENVREKIRKAHAKKIA